MPIGFFTVAPIGCGSCHTARNPDLVPASSAHSAVECVSCHVGASLNERVVFGYYQAFGMVSSVVTVRDSSISGVSDTACVSCHRLSGTKQSNGLRIRHEVCGEGSDCVDCHSGSAHPGEIRWPTTYTMDGCVTCHGIREVTGDCDSCHVSKLDRTRPTSSTFRFTHGPKWSTTHGMGDSSTCGACHRKDSCAKCHGAGVPHSQRFVSVHGPVASSSDADCRSCHEQSFCDDCHVHPMPHPAQFANAHRDLVQAEGDETCRTCHDPSDCTNCHERHVHPGGAGPLSPKKGDARL